MRFFTFVTLEGDFLTTVVFVTCFPSAVAAETVSKIGRSGKCELDCHNQLAIMVIVHHHLY
jgi:hypothetical protein